jgi:PadR family transcriptional regulator, regulatory protein PadR
MGSQLTLIRKPTCFVLASLFDGPLAGSGIIKRALELSDGRLRLATGTVYTVLDRLTAEGYVSPMSEQTIAGRTRRTYGLTWAVLTALQAEAARRLQRGGVASAAGWPATVGRVVAVGGRVRVGGKYRRR